MMTTTKRETFERICKLYGAEFNETTIAGVDVNDEYFISIVGCHPYNIHVNLFMKTSGKSIKVAYEAIKEGASDKVIMNRYNKLVEMVK